VIAQYNVYTTRIYNMDLQEL